MKRHCHIDAASAFTPTQPYHVDDQEWCTIREMLRSELVLTLFLRSLRRMSTKLDPTCDETNRSLLTTISPTIRDSWRAHTLFH